MIIKKSILLLLSLSISSAIAETSTVISSTSIHQSASINAAVITELDAGAQVEVLKRQGGWKLIQTKQEQPQYGWLRSYKVRQGSLVVETNQASSGGFFSGLANLSRKASGLFSSDKKEYSFQSTATIGVRGLSKEQIKSASPDYKELAKFDSYRVSKKSAQAFAKNGQLKSMKLPHLGKTKVEK